MLPILEHYPKYYGLKISVFLLAYDLLAMAAAALVVEFVFQILHLIPQERKAQIVEGTIRWNYTTILNIVFLALALVLVIRFFRTGGPAMMRMMSSPGHHGEDHA